jgi:hypothetical protein
MPAKPAPPDLDRPLTLRGYLFANAVSDGMNRLGLSREPSVDDRRRVIEAAGKLADEAVAWYAAAGKRS